MGANLTVSNRQRSVPVALSRYVLMYEKLWDATFLNLKNRPAKHLNAARAASIAKRGTLNVLLVSDANIRKLNKKWLGNDRPTDVLSFPLESEPPPVKELAWEIGEIVISVERAKEQAARFGHSLDREMGFLFVHGLLHVLGFDHQRPADEKEMFGRQNMILDESGLKR